MSNIHREKSLLLFIHIYRVTTITDEQRIIIIIIIIVVVVVVVYDRNTLISV